MTATTKRKHVVKEMLEDFSIPDKEQSIVKVLGTPGSNLHEGVTAEGEKFLCSLPTKFRKNIWIKRGDFVVVESISEGDKVKAEIVRILYPQHVKYLRKSGSWPKQFEPNENLGKWPTFEDTEKVAKEMSDLKIENPPFSKQDYILNHDQENGSSHSVEDCYSSEDDLSDIPANTNRPTVAYEDDTTSESEDEFE